MSPFCPSVQPMSNDWLLQEYTDQALSSAIQDSSAEQPGSKAPVKCAEASAAVKSPFSLLRCLLLCAFLHHRCISRKHTPICSCHPTLWIRVCFQGTYSKTFCIVNSTKVYSYFQNCNKSSLSPRDHLTITLLSKWLQTKTMGFRILTGYNSRQSRSWARLLCPQLLK